MSHRALVAVAREEGRYDVHYAHDGGDDDRLARLRRPDAEPPRDLVGSTPRATGLTFDALLADYLDPIEHEALVVIERDGEVVPFVVVPYVLATADGLAEWEPRGAAVALTGRDGSTLHPALVRGWHQGTTEVLGEAVDTGVLTLAEAFGWLNRAVRRLAGERHRLAVVP